MGGGMLGGGMVVGGMAYGGGYSLQGGGMLGCGMHGGNMGGPHELRTTRVEYMPSVSDIGSMVNPIGRMKM
jgi:hypothetical protein